MMNRETIYAALFDRLKALSMGDSPAFVTATRNLKLWDNVPPENCPALLQTQRIESVSKLKGQPPRWTLGINLYIYVHTDALNNLDVVPATLLNPLIDLVTEVALASDDIYENACTLGGLVSSCYVDGTLEIFEGNLGNEAVVIIPITMVVPS